MQPAQNGHILINYKHCCMIEDGKAKRSLMGFKPVTTVTLASNSSELVHPGLAKTF